MSDQGHMEEELNTSNIYGALMRPPMKWGVPYNFIPAILFIGCIVLIALSPIYAFFVYLPIAWFLGWVMGKFDPDVMKVMHQYAHVYIGDGEVSGSESLYTYSAF